jgi:hypothetical protein
VVPVDRDGLGSPVLLHDNAARILGLPALPAGTGGAVPPDAICLKACRFRRKSGHQPMLFQPTTRPDEWWVVLPLWTREEGKSNLSIEATILESSSGVSVVIDDIRAH